MKAKNIIEKAIKEARGKGRGKIISRDDIYNAILQAGRKDVVAWIREQPTVRDNLNIYLIPEYELKEWEDKC